MAHAWPPVRSKSTTCPLSPQPCSRRSLSRSTARLASPLASGKSLPPNMAISSRPIRDGINGSRSATRFIVFRSPALVRGAVIKFVFGKGSLMESNVSPTVMNCQSDSGKTVCSPKLRRVKRQMRIFIEMNGTKQEALESGMGLSKGELTKFLSDGYPNAMGVHHLPDWTREVGPEFENWLRDQNEHEAPVTTQAPMTLAAMLSRYSGQEVAAIIQDIQSGGVRDAHERNDRLPGLHKLKAILDALIVEAGRQDAAQGAVS